MKYLFLLLLNISIAQAQQINLRGSTIDAQTNQPIPEATISIQAKNLFFPTDNKGRFDINTDKITNTDSVVFSCIGYQSKKVKAGNMQTNSIIKLMPMVNMLQEVKVGVNSPKVGSKAKHDDIMSSHYPDFERAMFMHGSEKIKGIVKTVGFYLGNGHILSNNSGGDVTAPFRIKLYAIDTSGAPGEEITKDIIIVSAKKNNAWFDVDISAYCIEDPDSGFFVSFCLLDTGYYKAKKGYDYQYNHMIWSSAYIATPRLGTTEHEFKESQCYVGGSGYWGWQWNKEPFNDSYMIRATIMPE